MDVAQMQIIEAPTLEQMIALPDETEVIVAMPIMHPVLPFPVGINFECMTWNEDNRDVARHNFSAYQTHNDEVHGGNNPHPLIMFIIYLIPQPKVPDSIPASWTTPSDEKGR